MSRHGSGLRRTTPRPMGAALAFALLAVATLAGAWNFAAGRWAQADAKRLRVIVARSGRLLSTMKDLEIGERGYALTGKADYLDPYVAALSHLDAQLDALDAADPARATAAARALAPVRGQVAEERAFYARVVDARRDLGADAATALVSTGQGRRLMEGIEAAKAASDEAAGAETARIEDADRTRSVALTLVLLAAAAAAVALLMRQSLARRRDSQDARRRLEDVLDNAPVGLGFIGRDLGLRRMNRALAALAEGALGAEVGGPLWAAQPALEASLRPLLLASLERGAVTSDVDVPVADPAVPGGTRHLRMGFYPLLDQGGAEEGGVGVAVVDLTDARLSEGRVREGEAVLRAVLDTLPVGVLIAEAPSGRIRDHNARAEQILGHGVLPAAGGGGPARWIGHHEDGRPVQPGEWPLVRVVRGDEPLAELEVDYRCGDGRRAWVDFTGAPMRDPSGRVSGGVVVVTDVDARKRAEQALALAKDAAEAASRAKSTFLANMSHELRTPLSAIIGYSEVLREEIEDGVAADALSADVGRIESNARHLLGLINDVLDLSKVESGKMEVFPETFAVEPLLRDLAATVGSVVAKRNNRLELRVPPDIGTMRSDLTKVRQMLLNLVGNAAKFTEGGLIVLEARRTGKGDRLSFSVADTGIGMTPEQVSRLFQRFAQADSSTTRRFGGTGLGLSIARAFADMLGGTIAVDSEAGRGSTFTLDLPADPAPAEAAGLEPSRAPV